MGKKCDIVRDFTVSIDEVLKVKEVHFQSLEELENILKEEAEALDFINIYDFSTSSPAILAIVRARFLGKQSPTENLLKSLRQVADKRTAGERINSHKVYVNAIVASFEERWQEYFEQQALSEDTTDPTLPGREILMGSRHPVKVVMRDLLVPFQRMGFTVVDGPEIDLEHFNFDCLNIPKDHPAREMQDTFFVNSEWVLRTHTSNVQSHSMFSRSLPLRIVCPGAVYRKEFDLTHIPCFRQIECLVVDENIHMGHLKGLIHELVSAAMGRPVPIRFRSSYFPFTEPSAEVDVQCQKCSGKGCRGCKYIGWSELGGCGVVHRKVLESCGIDSKKYQGIAFGFGVDRMAKDRFGIGDIRLLIDGNIPFLKSFSLQ